MSQILGKKKQLLIIYAGKIVGGHCSAFRMFFNAADIFWRELGL